MMRGRLVQIDLPEPRDLLPEAASDCRATFNVSLKRNFGPRQQANGDVGLADCGKTAGHRVTKSGRD